MSRILFSLATLLVVANVTHAYSVPKKSTTISGLSAGGFMAVQYHVAFSSDMAGIAVYAGGPFFCAQGEIGIALSACMSMPVLIDTDALASKAKDFASKGAIDSLDGLANTKVYLYSGSSDSVVVSDVVKKNADFYTRVSNDVEITHEYSIDSEHCLPTVDYGNQCGHLGTPFINKCGYDGPYKGLSAIIPGLKPKATANADNLIKIDMTKFFPNGQQPVGFSKTAWVYMPTACAGSSNATLCSIHISFHGCEQDFTQIGDAWYAKAGFNDIAESNNLVVLYPQSESSLLSNPKACFDWWGYSGGIIPGSETYATKNGVQMATVASAVAYLKTSPSMQDLQALNSDAVQSQVVNK
eukprot:TRINITY_DN760_c0_g3_i1.p1 TRINITY_DN760_c0_g3~~TRINITY_DN760_c0_g3_i1.p1  ORF type:complete len:355 (-),score=92.54 TRINITY_DN760_c0_g3_i1:113-1177(-)